jgi:hypothetical protein
MIGRLFIALVGALVVTSFLLFAMDAVTSVFRERDSHRYYRITDILPKPDPGRPVRPEPVSRPPALPGRELTRPAAGLGIETPGAGNNDVLERPSVRGADIERPALPDSPSN